MLCSDNLGHQLSYNHQLEEQINIIKLTKMMVMMMSMVVMVVMITKTLMTSLTRTQARMPVSRKTERNQSGIGNRKSSSV